MNKQPKIGLLCCFYNCAENLEKVITPWVKAKEKHDIKVAISHGMFLEYSKFQEDNDRETLDLLCNNRWDNFMYIQNDYYHVTKERFIYENEATIRNYSLQYLIKEKCDVIILLDGDEFWTELEIDKLVEFINDPKNEYYCWFGVNYRNYILDNKQWISGFCPPRVFRLNYGDYKLDSLYHDNDCVYKNKLGLKMTYKNLSYKEIPKEYLQPRHETWLDNEKTKGKIFYQHAHFGKGNCSYKIKDGHVCIDYGFYLLNGLPVPIIHKD